MLDARCSIFDTGCRMQDAWGSIMIEANQLKVNEHLACKMLDEKGKILDIKLIFATGYSKP
jgi:hypothetical protein